MVEKKAYRGRMWKMMGKDHICVGCDPCVQHHKFQQRKKSHGMIDDLNNVDFVSSNVNSSRQEALLYVFEDNEAVIKMIIEGRSPTMRHVSRTHRVALRRRRSFGSWLTRQEYKVSGSRNCQPKNTWNR